MDKATIANLTLNDEAVRAIGRAITDAGDAISSSIASLTLNFSSDMAIAVTIIGALSAGLTAFIFNLIHERISQRSIRLTRLASLLDQLVLELETLSTKYWSTDYEVATASDSFISETKIKSLLRYINANIKILSGYRCRHIKDDEKEKLADFCLEIFDLVTGDGFESCTRKASREKVARISLKCIEARTVLCKMVSM